MKNELTKERKYILAKKRVEKIKGFYWHAVAYVIVNVFISSVIVIGLMSDEGDTFKDAISNFGVYATWLFWGIGLFFHWLGVFGSRIFFSKNWEEQKIQEFMNENNR
ncbi:2TM domain-containing protein [Tenacibaculum sp. 190524A02b]|uniref:2TM domain-containing protein n=1 Tax=Tenacibaculum vairaonense TaxID=3137860 RepID=UPI0032B137E7